MTITLRNDFHNTSARALVAHGRNLTHGQIRRVALTLCGDHSCQCGAVRGQQDAKAVAWMDSIDGTWAWPVALKGGN